jgi:hypothetical protein
VEEAGLTSTLVRVGPEAFVTVNGVVALTLFPTVSFTNTLTE